MKKIKRVKKSSENLDFYLLNGPFQFLHFKEKVKKTNLL